MLGEWGVLTSRYMRHVYYVCDVGQARGGRLRQTVMSSFMTGTPGTGVTSDVTIQGDLGQDVASDGVTQN